MLVCQGELDIGSSFSSTTEETDVVIPQLAPYPQILFFLYQEVIYSNSQLQLLQFFKHLIVLCTAKMVAKFQVIESLPNYNNTTLPQTIRCYLSLSRGSFCGHEQPLAKTKNNQILFCAMPRSWDLVEQQQIQISGSVQPLYEQLLVPTATRVRDCQINHLATENSYIERNSLRGKSVYQQPWLHSRSQFSLNSIGVQEFQELLKQYKMKEMISIKFLRTEPSRRYYKKC